MMMMIYFPTIPLYDLPPNFTGVIYMLGETTVVKNSNFQLSLPKMASLAMKKLSFSTKCGFGITSDEICSKYLSFAEIKTANRGQHRSIDSSKMRC